jgi:integrase
MARRVKDLNLESREARAKLKSRSKPYWRTIGRGLHLGYRKNKTGHSVWVSRQYVGGAYRTKAVGLADDVEDANGDTVLDFWQAQDFARNLRAAQKLSVTVKDAITAYLRFLEGRPSWVTARSRAHTSILPELGKLQIDELDPETIRTWHKGIAQRGPQVRSNGTPKFRKTSSDHDAVRKRRATANNYLLTLKAALNHVWKEQRLSVERTWAHVKPFPNTTVAKGDYFTLDEVRDILAVAESTFQVLVRAAFETGARYQEIARLRVRDFHDGTLHIRKSKTNKDRHVFLTEDGAAFFAGLVARRRPDELVLGKEWHAGMQTRPMKLACKKAGVRYRSFHLLRHTWASHAVMGGMPLTVVARNLGHADTKMVERVYGHLAPSYVAQAVRDHAPRLGVTS